MSLVEITFLILSVIAIGSALMTVLSKNPIHSAIYLLICFSSIAGHYLLLNAQFLFIVHIIVYSGAIYGAVLNYAHVAKLERRNRAT